MAKILIVDDEARILMLLQSLLKANNYEAQTAKNGEEALEILKRDESFDIVMARAVARLNILDELCLPLVKKDGYFLSLKGLKAPEELKDAKGGIKVLGGEVMDDFTFTLSDQNDHRHNIVIKKVKSTPAKYPRNYGQIKKKPL